MSDAADIVALFVRKEKRERLLALLEKASRRADFRDALLHDRRNLDPTTLTPLAPHGLTVDRIIERVGARTNRAHCIGGAGPNDGVNAPLGELLASEALRSRDVIVFDVKTRRAYYENHEGESFLLRRS